MGHRYFVNTMDELVKVIDALEVLGKHYLISTIDRELRSSFRPAHRWIVEESETGNPLEYEDGGFENG